MEPEEAERLTSVGVELELVGESGLRVNGVALPRDGRELRGDEVKTAYLAASKEAMAWEETPGAKEVFQQFVAKGNPTF